MIINSGRHFCFTVLRFLLPCYIVYIIIIRVRAGSVIIIIFITINYSAAIKYSIYFVNTYICAANMWTEIGYKRAGGHHSSNINIIGLHKWYTFSTNNYTKRTYSFEPSCCNSLNYVARYCCVFPRPPLPAFKARP